MAFSTVGRTGLMRLSATRSFLHAWLSFLPELNFMTLHYLYFVMTILVVSLIFWGCSRPDQSIDYVDCLFVVTSAMTETGLSTILLSKLNLFQQIILFVLIICGSSIFVSFFVVLFRKRAFESRFANVVASYEAERREDPRGRLGLALESTQEAHLPDILIEQLDGTENLSSTIQNRLTSAFRTQDKEKRNNTYVERQRQGNIPTDSTQRMVTNVATFKVPPGDIVSRSTSKDTSGSEELSREDRERLGGAEYGAIKLLFHLVPAYYLTWQLLGCLSTALYIVYYDADVAGSNATNPWWLGIFLAVSAFNNCGLSLLDAGMVPFEKDIYLLISFSLMILAGNVAYPILLRLFMWLGSKAFPKDEKHHRRNITLRFILDYPRRVYTHIFPSAHTWWLLAILIVFTGVDWVAFSAFNVNNLAVTSIPVPFREAVGFFQSISIRSAGFNLIPVPQLSISTQVITVVMMYISAYPVLITMRSSNVYEETSLGIYTKDLKVSGDVEKNPRADPKGARGQPVARTRLFFLRQQLQYQLAHDLWWLTLVSIIVVCIEASNYDHDPKTYSIFNIIFEVVSAYAPVGLSTGLPDQLYSLSGGFHLASKLILVAVMIRGRHRGLPLAIDKAVLLPGERSSATEQSAFWMHGGRAAHDSPHIAA